MAHKDIIQRTENYVTELLTGKLSPKLIYHNLNHTLTVVNNAQKIGKKSDLNEDELEIVTLAAWFHDAGYIDSYKDHEDRGKQIAEEFLKGNNYDPVKLEKVLGCIDATRMPQQPKDMVEQVLCDADLLHLGMESFFEYSDMLRNEWESIEIKKTTEPEWFELGEELLTEHSFFTPYAKKKFGPQQTLNLIKLQRSHRKLLKELDNQSEKKEKLQFEKEKLEIEKQKIALRKDDEKLAVEKEKIAFKKESAKVAERGIETMFRNTIRTHVEFSAMADSKANIMISINTLIIGIIVTTLLRKLVEYPYLIAPTFILLTVCLVCIVFAVFVTRPNVTSGLFTKEDIESKKTNLLFFGNFFKMPLTDFQWGMNKMMSDKEYLYGSMVKDFYFLGQVLGRKYKYLRICYTIFMYGLIISVLAYTIAFILNPEQHSKPLDLLN